MRTNNPDNPEDLKDLILRRLGAPIHNIELTTDQIYDCIDRALELFYQYHSDGTNLTYKVCKLTEEQASSGLIQLDNDAIAVTKILRAGSNIYTMDGKTTLTWFSNWLFGLTGGGDTEYSGFNGGIFNNGSLVTYSLFMSYQNMLYDQLDPIPKFYYNETNHQMRVFGNLMAGDFLVFEMYVPTGLYSDQKTNVIGNGYRGAYGSEPDPVNIYDNPNYSLAENSYIGGPELSPLGGVFKNRWVKNYATALAKQLWGFILSKNQNVALVGNITINGQFIYDAGTSEIEKLEEELDGLDIPLGVFYG